MIIKLKCHIQIESKKKRQKELDDVENGLL